MLAVDTCVLIDVFDGLPKAVDWWQNLDEMPRVPVFVVMELLHGCNSKSDMDSTWKWVSRMDRLWMTSAQADASIHLFRTQKLKTGIKLMDAFIAQCCIHNKAILATHDAHFKKVKGLKIIKPY